MALRLRSDHRPRPRLGRSAVPVLARTVAVALVAALPFAGAGSAGAATGASIIDTFAGDGVAQYAGDGGLAVNASLNLPRDTDVAPDGTVYVADTYNNKVRVISPAGVIRTLAGTGKAGAAGDGGPARQATLSLPHDVVVDDNTRVVYVADANNHRIRSITTDGIIRTVAGTGVAGYSGDGGPANQAQLRNPKGIALYGKYLYISDSKNHVVRRVDRKTGIIETVAGTGIAGFGGDGGLATAAKLDTPQRLTCDPFGTVYVTDSVNNRIRRFVVGGTITTVAGNGVKGYNGDGRQATTAQLNNPRGIAVAGRTRLYFSDSENQRVRAVNLTTGVITTVAGGVKGYGGDGGPAKDAMFINPRGLTLDNQGRLLVADVYNSRIRIIAP